MNGNYFDWLDRIIANLLLSQFSFVPQVLRHIRFIVSILFHCLLSISSLFFLPLLSLLMYFCLEGFPFAFVYSSCSSCCTLRRVLWNALSWEVSLSDCPTPSPELFMATDLSYRPFPLLSFCAAIALFRLSVMRYLEHGEIAVSSLLALKLVPQLLLG